MAKSGEKVRLMLHEAVAEWLTKPERMKGPGVNLLQKRSAALDLIKGFPEDTFFVVVPVVARLIYPPEVWEKIQLILPKMLEKARSDKRYRKLCIADPASAFKEVTGKNLPKGASLRFVEPGTQELTDADIIRVSREVSELKVLGPQGMGPVTPYGVPNDWSKIDIPK